MASSIKFLYSIKEPLNREPPAYQLLSSFITDCDGYDRNHGPIPVIDAGLYRVSIEGRVSKPLKLSLADLQSYEQHSMICALQCAGNRRHTMRTLLKEVQGIDWFEGAVMNCKWKGPRLRDVLLQAGLDIGQSAGTQTHVEFSCHQNPSQETDWYGTSIPLELAMAPDAEVIIALEMNDKPLTHCHGFPARIIAPGLAGVRSVKWLDCIKVQFEQSSNHFHQRDYKILPPEVDTSEVAEFIWSQVPPLHRMPVNSAIGVPATGSDVQRDENGLIHVCGYALPGYKSGPITSVEVSADEGHTWQEAHLYLGMDNKIDKSSLKWAWCLWETRVRMGRGTHTRVLSRATDRGGNRQENARTEWNLRGVGYHGYGEASDLNIL